MEYVLGRTEISVCKWFWCASIQRISDAEAAKLIHKAYDHGINLFDTANFYTDSGIRSVLRLPRWIETRPF